MTSAKNLSSQAPINVDIAIFGGGVAGLWLLARLRKLNYNAVLFERDALGAGQTRFAQGIIHGGTKYALTGKLSAAAEAVSAMPGLWRACLQGGGELDLSSVKVWSQHQYLWSTAGLGSRLAGFFANRIMRSRIVEVKNNDRPLVFQNAYFKGHVYRLDEPVLDTASLVTALAQPHLDAIFQVAQAMQLTRVNDQQLQLTVADGATIHIKTKATVLTAGKGNSVLLSALNRNEPQMQLRPLHMVVMRGKLPELLYAHCLGPSANPRITITSHQDQKSDIVWYVGGQIAEQGVNRAASEQIRIAQTEMKELMPWLDFSTVQWSTLRIDRAEPKQADGSRPETVYANMRDKIITAWPTKLALAPMLAEEITTLLEAHDIMPSGHQDLPQWPHPAYAPLPWQEESTWNIER